jgi:hypothetical protein
VKKQVAMKTTGYKKLHVTAMLCIIANGNKLPPYVILNRNTVAKENFCLKICMDDMEVNGRLVWMFMGMSAWCIFGAMEYACNGCIL